LPYFVDVLCNDTGGRSEAGEHVLMSCNANKFLAGPMTPDQRNIAGVGALMAAGPVMNAIAGGVIGAGVTAGSALATLGIALHRVGIPKQKLEPLNQAIMDGKTLLLIHCGHEDPQALKQRLRWQGAEKVSVLP
jgi:hypothetical protein